MAERIAGFSMAKWIFNDSGTEKTYLGQTISNQAYYQIQAHEEVLWANNDALLTDIGSGDAVVSTTNAIGGHLGVADGINHLKDIVAGPTDISGVKEPNGMRARLVGIIDGTVTAGTTADLDWAMPQLQYPSGTNRTSYFDGIEYYTDGAVGDSCDFQVVDVDGIAYPAGTVLEEFGTGVYLLPNVLQDIILYKAKIVPGMYLRLKYTSTGVSDVKVVANLFRHLDGNS